MKCGLCQGEIMWAKTAKGGKSVPLDMPPNPNGKAWINGDGKVEVESADNPKPPNLRRSFSLHFPRCPGYATKQRIKQKLQA